MGSYNHTQGTIEGIPLEEFDEYIFPITRGESDSLSFPASFASASDAKTVETIDHSLNIETITSINENINSTTQNFTKGSILSKRRRNETVLTDTEESEGGSGGNLRKAATHNRQNQDSTEGYLRMQKSVQLQIQEKELKLLDKKDGLKGSDGLIHSRVTRTSPGESLYGRWKAPEDNQDNIHHTAILSYTIKSIEDYGTVSCFGSLLGEKFGKQLFPCIFHIISSEQLLPFISLLYVISELPTT